MLVSFPFLHLYVQLAQAQVSLLQKNLIGLHRVLISTPLGWTGTTIQQQQLSHTLSPSSPTSMLKLKLVSAWCSFYNNNQNVNYRNIIFTLHDAKLQQNVELGLVFSWRTLRCLLEPSEFAYPSPRYYLKLAWCWMDYVSFKIMWKCSFGIHSGCHIYTGNDGAVGDKYLLSDRIMQ